MKTLLLVVVLGAACWVGFTRYQQWQGHRHGAPRGAHSALAGSEDVRFSCDGRVYCSQMTSCEEATYFLEHCPGTKMDGNHDGVPCERQWCK